jgi:hypothetical protein
MKFKHIFMVCIMIFVMLSNSGAPSFAYSEKTTHIKINAYATQQSGLDFILKQRFGFDGGIECKIKNKKVFLWIEEGGKDEDDTLSSDGAGVRYRKHFHDPLKPWGSAGLLAFFDSALSWALNFDDNPTTVDNKYSWAAARQYFYNSLIDDNPEDYYAKMFRALGQVMHLLSDGAVPSHVRDDAHPGMGLDYIYFCSKLAADLYEKWAEENYDKEQEGKINYTGRAVDPAIFSRADLSQVPSNPISALWDQNVYTGGNPSSTWVSDLGLAEFTNANFLSQDTKFGPYPHPDLLQLPVSTQIIEERTAEDGKIDRVYYILHPERGYRLASLTFLDYYHNSSGGDYGEDDAVWQDYAAELIPRAVGYSTALLNYFFRGTIEISAPDGFVYSIIDGSVSPQQFMHIKAKLKNITPDEEMLEGTLIAVAKYKKRTDYREDLLTDPPLKASREADFSYSVSESIPIQSLSALQPEDYTFDFSDDPIPAGITDLFLQVIFKGTLGGEKDIAVAVGMRDLNEPSHHVIWNSTDQIVYRDVLYTAEEVRTNFRSLADLDGDGVFNEIHEGEPYIDPYAFSKKMIFTKEDPETTPQPLIGYATVSGLPAGRYSRIIVLADLQNNEHAWLTSSINRPWYPPDVYEDEYYSFNMITAQENPNLPWSPSPLSPSDYTHRGVRQHYFLTEYYCLSTLGACSYLGAQRPGSLNPMPYPVTITFP